MRLQNMLVIIAIITLLYLPFAYATTKITGTATAKRAVYVKVDFQAVPGAVPENGDRVDFKKMISGIEAKAGYGKVTQSGNGFALVKIEKEPVQIKMTGIIHATGNAGGLAKGRKKTSSAKELTGIITGIKDGILDIEISAGDLPESYDPVRIIWDVDDEVLVVGNAWVQRIWKDRRQISAKLSDGEPAVGMLVRIPHDQYRFDIELNNAIRSAQDYKIRKEVYEELKEGEPPVDPLVRIRNAINNGADVDNIWYDWSQHPLIML